MSFSATVMDHFFNPRHAYRMTDPHAVGQAGTPGAGPFMTLYLKLDGERISESSFQTFGCAPAIAAGSLLTERLRGALTATAASWDQRWLEAELGGLPRHKKHCAELAIQALTDALAKTGSGRHRLGRATRQQSPTESTTDVSTNKEST